MNAPSITPGLPHNARILNIEETQWDETLQVHLKGAFHLSQTLLKPLMKQEGGHIIFISSIVASTGNIGQAAYTSAKAGLVGLARSLAQEYGSRNIRVNVVNPGFHKTRLAEGLTPEAEAAILSRHLLGKSADLDEVCTFFLWLASSETFRARSLIWIPAFRDGYDPPLVIRAMAWSPPWGRTPMTFSRIMAGD